MLVAPVPRITIMIGAHPGRRYCSPDSGDDRGTDLACRGLPRYDIRRLALAFLYMVLIAVMFTAMGTAIASLLSDFQGFQLVMNFLVMPMFFLSGALFPLTNLPVVLNILTTIDPLSYGVDGLRGSFIGVSHFGATH